VIADGGIKNSGDIAEAIAAGADASWSARCSLVQRSCTGQSQPDC